MKDLLFVLGESRTGITTIHKFLKTVGFNLIHNFFNESDTSELAHLYYEENLHKLKSFIDNSAYNAFSDCQLRIFYKDLIKLYPDAYFILSTRSSNAIWKKSMESIFSQFKIDQNIDELTKRCRSVNKDIRNLASQKGLKFCEICIDDPTDQNGQIISDFLNLPKSFPLGWGNRTNDYENGIWSSRATFYNTSCNDYLSYIKQEISPYKGMLSEFGWTYLINDSAEFFDFLYGDNRWSTDQVNSAKNVLQKRFTSLQKRSIDYLKFIIPEKSVVYPEYLPKIFSDKKENHNRPAKQLQSLDFVYYLEGLLKDAKSRGFVYFKGDSHTNWLGAFFVYQAIVDAINNSDLCQTEKKKRKSISLNDLTPTLASYAGDVFNQMDPKTKDVFNGAWKAISLDNKLEHLVRYQLPADKKKAKRISVDTKYLEHLGKRETFRFAQPDKSLPKAVIFRDSTSDYIVELLAEHFSDSLFIWHKGLVYDDVIQKENPDIVIHIMAERFTSMYSKFPTFSNLLPNEIK
ncbi:sulfotransferase [Flexibacterium corallicola]|uniref:sulfotransferase n=1 Tax=Flexibacterium corallicola TaxID=3037259 RepID=UPI00286F7110|nr:sulfotransferase [Pseudovibrio sp. M1P-2-3]